jgi:hypothetical protein
MPVLHRAIAATAITFLVLSLIFVAQQIALNSLTSIPISAQHVAARKPAPLKAIATSVSPSRPVAKVIGVARPPLPAPPKKRSL